MEKRVSKLLNILLAMVLMVTSVGIPVKAEEFTGGYQGEWTEPIPYASHSLSIDFSVGWELGGTSYGEEGLMSVNGDTVFCLERHKPYFGGMPLTPTEDFGPVGINHDQKLKLSLIAYFGKQRAIQSNNRDWYSIVQNAIWAETDGVSPSNLRGYVLSDTFNSKEKIVNAINTLYQDVDRYHILPSFNRTTVSIKAGESIRLTDTNGVLNTFKVNSTDGLNVRIEGNDLVVTGTANALDNARITFVKNIKPEDTGISIMYDNGSNYQKLGMFRVGDPNKGYVNFEVQKNGTLKLAKRDEDGSYVPNTTFAVSYNSDMNGDVWEYTTGSDGTVTIPNWQPRTVYIQEKRVPNHLILDSSIHSVTIKANETVTYTATNKIKNSYIQVVKKDLDTGKTIIASSTTFNVHKEDGTIVAEIHTNDKGIAKSNKLRYGNYYLTEKNAPNGYIHSDKQVKYQLTEDGKTYSAEFANKRVTGTIELSKVDGITGSQPQGEGTLQGAVYGLFARKDILDPADGTIIHKAGTKVSELITNAEGKASISNLFLGNYYLKELQASQGYTLDDTEYDIELSYQGQNVEIVTKQQTVKERVGSQAFSIIKISDGGNGDVEYLEGVEFTIKSQKDIEKFGSWEEAPIAKNAKGEEANLLITDKKGQAISDELAYGTYVVRETKAPDDYYTVPDFTVVISEDSREPQAWKVLNDRKFKAVIKIVKVDEETGKTVAIEGATFKIKDLKTNQYVGYWGFNPLPSYITTWTTDKSGVVYTSETIKAGTYQLEEIKAPNGYLLNSEPVQFKITMNGAFEMLPDGNTPVITVVMKDQSVQGQITIEKRGEVLTGYQDGKFVYNEQGLAGMTADIIAKENIMDPSNDGTILYQKGEVVDTVATQENGKATSKKLPLGVYEVSEVTAPNGMVINETPQTIELKYKDQSTDIVYEDVTFSNDRQKVKASLLKLDEEGTIGLSGAEFNLIAKEDIVNADGTVIVKAGTVLKRYTSDEYGDIAIDLDLPLNVDYALKEVKAPIGYILNKTEILFNTDYQGQDVKEIVIEKTKENERTKVNFSKTDVTTGKELAGNHLSIFEKGNEGSTFTSWISTDTPHLVENLSVDTRYILREKSSVKGFYLATDIEFEIVKDGTVYIFDEEGNKEIAKDNLVVMENDLVTGKLNWNKSGEIFTSTITGQTEFGKVEEPVWKTSNLLGSEITIYAAEDITLGNGVTYYHKDEAIQTLESDLEPVQSKELLVGKYYYVETKTPHGYVIDTDKHYFSVEDNQSSNIQIIDSTLINKRPQIQVEFTKYMEQYKHHNKIDNAYKDVVFGIFAREDIYDYMGNVGIKNETLISTTGIDEIGQLLYVPDLPNGVYYLKELQTSPDYVLDTNEYDFEVAYHGQDVSSYTIMIDDDGAIENKLIRGSIRIMKKDSFDKDKVLDNVAFNISVDPNMSNIIGTALTENGVASFNNMEIGKYYIQEAKQEAGYVLNDHIYEVEITTNGEILTIEVDNKPTEVFFTKVDETGVNELEGAKMQLVSSKTKQIVDEWISTKEPHVIKYLVEGEKYILKELEAPTGYIVAKDIEFIASDGQTITMKDELILTDIQVNKVDSVTKETIKNKDFEFTVYADKECKEAIKTVHANTEDGTATFEDIPYGTYFIKETKAPKGYELSKEVKKVVVDDNLDGVGDIYSFVYENTLLPSKTVNTGDNTNIMLYGGLASASLIGIFYAISKKKKHILH